MGFLASLAMLALKPNRTKATFQRHDQPTDEPESDPVPLSTWGRCQEPPTEAANRESQRLKRSVVGAGTARQPSLRAGGSFAAQTICMAFRDLAGRFDLTRIRFFRSLRFGQLPSSP